MSTIGCLEIRSLKLNGNDKSSKNAECEVTSYVDA